MATSAAVRFSERARRADAQQALLFKTLVAVEDGLRSGEALFETAGRSHYLDSISNPPDLSSEATAGRILGGITGYIFGAFRTQHPDLTLEEFERFESEVRRGFERGMGEAREMLGALEVSDGTLAAEVDETERLVREGLDRFFADQRERVLRPAA